jgi:hypothetical protein
MIQRFKLAELAHWDAVHLAFNVIGRAQVPGSRGSLAYYRELGGSVVPETPAFQPGLPRSSVVNK